MDDPPLRDRDKIDDDDVPELLKRDEYTTLVMMRIQTAKTPTMKISYWMTKRLLK